jgi:hypothetical protein
MHTGSSLVEHSIAHKSGVGVVMGVLVAVLVRVVVGVVTSWQLSVKALP